MGRGLVEAVDDIRDANPPSNPALFAALTRDFVSHEFDVKHLIRTIMNSTAYQLTSMPTATNAADLRYHSHYIAKRLPAEVIIDAMGQVTGIREEFAGFPGRRALQLPDAAVESYFLTAFGRPPRITAAHSERQEEPSITQALHVINGDTVNRKLRDDRSIVGRLIATNADNRTAIDQLYLLALSRPPSDEELRRLTQVLEPAEGDEPRPRRQVLEDLAWAILTGREFLFNH
jgi:hypothetical protein